MPLTPGFQKSSPKMTKEDATYPWVPEEFAKDDQRGRRHVETSVRGGDRQQRHLDRVVRLKPVTQFVPRLRTCAAIYPDVIV